MELLTIAKNIADRVEAESSRVNVPVSVKPRIWSSPGYDSV